MARVGPNLLQGEGGEARDLLKAGSTTTEGPGPGVHLRALKEQGGRNALATMNCNSELRTEYLDATGS